MEKVKKEKVIFLHSMFRAGSTYMFNKFRIEGSFWTYYEPLHHDLVKLKQDTLDIWKFDKKATNVMNHPELNKPHFYEFKNAFNNNMSLPYYDTDFAYKEFFCVQKNDELKRYIDNLIDTAEDKKIPVFQFNRSSLRVDWFKKRYPESLNVFLLRNSRDQFESYFQRNVKEKNVFLAINIYIILYNKKATEYLLSDKSAISFSGNIGEDLNICMKMSGELSVEKHYEIFYFIWIHSYLHGEEYADYFIDMDRMNSDKKYIKEIKTKIFNETNVLLEFDDYNIKTNENYSLDVTTSSEIENKICKDYNYHITYDYISRTSENKKDGLFRRLFKKFINYKNSAV